MIEGERARSLVRVNQHELLGTIFEVIAIPESRVVVEPVRCDTGLEYLSLRLSGKLAGALIGLAHVEGVHLARRVRLWLLGRLRVAVQHLAFMHGVFGCGRQHECAGSSQRRLHRSGRTQPGIAKPTDAGCEQDDCQPELARDSRAQLSHEIALC